MREEPTLADFIALGAMLDPMVRDNVLDIEGQMKVITRFESSQWEFRWRQYKGQFSQRWQDMIETIIPAP